MGTTYIWYPGASSGAWGSSADWVQLPSGNNPAGPPGSGDVAIFNTSAQVTSGSGAANFVSVNAFGGTVTFEGSLTSGSFELSPPAQFIGGVTSDINGGSVSASNEVLVSAGSALTIEAAGTLQGPGAGAQAQTENFGTIALLGQSTMKGDTYHGFGSTKLTSGLANYTTFEAASALGGSGSLDVQGGGTITDTQGFVTGLSGGTSTATLTGSAEWRNDYFAIATSGNASVTLTSGATISAAGGSGGLGGQTPLSIGYTGGVTGTAAIESGSRITVTGDATLGYSGDAVVDITGLGILDLSGKLNAAVNASGKATIDIGGGASLLQVGGDAVIGQGGTASVAVSGGGTLTVTGSLDAGAAGNASGSLDVNGALLHVGGGVTLGDAGGGSLTLGGGGTLEVGGTLLEGAQHGSSGSFTVNDSADVLNLGGDWIIGDLGAHTDSVSGGASFDVTGALDLGRGAGGAGTLTLADSGTKVTVGTSLTVGDAGQGSLDVGAGATLEAFNAALLIGAQGGASGTLALSGGFARLMPGTDVTVGGGGSGTLTVAANATLDPFTGGLVLGNAAGGAGVLSLDGSGNKITVGTDTTIGKGGAGTMTLGAGATLDATSGSLDIAQAGGSSGTLTLGGADAYLTTQSATVGDGGAGTVTIATTGTLSTTGDVLLGAVSGGSGVMALSAGGLVDDGGNLTVGGAGQGSLDINGATLSLTGASFTIGDAHSGNGDVTLANTSFSVLGTAVVGNAGTATLSVNQGATFDAGGLDIGKATGANGSFVVDGSGSKANGGAVTVGDGGTGSMQVTDSAVLDGTSGVIGAQAISIVQSSVTVDTNASWQVGTVLDVAQGGNAALTVQGGGQVLAAAVTVGDNGGATGTVDVTGTGAAASALAFGTTLVVGNHSAGALGIEAGGRVGPQAQGAGTVEIGLQTDGVGRVSLGGAGSQLTAALLAVGGGAAAGGAGTLAIGAGATVAVASATIWGGGVVSLTGGSLLTDPIDVQGNVSGYGVLGGAVTDNGTITASGGTLQVTGTIGGGGALALASGMLELGQGVSGVAIQVGAGVLRLDALASMSATVSGFGHAATIELPGVVANGGSFSAGVLHLTENGTAVPGGSIALAGSYTSGSFSYVNNGGTTDITTSAPCFAAGTRIATAAGWTTVEALAAGDVVRLALGGTAPVRWVGHRRVRCDRHPRPADVWPVEIAAGAFGPGMPERALRLSPDHAVWFCGKLIPARYLVNGATVRQVPCAAVTYFHVELDRHDVVLAEGLACESYLDTGNRGAFANGGAVAVATADFARGRWAAAGCAPLALERAEQMPALLFLRHQARSLGWRRSRAAAVHVTVDGRGIAARPENDGWTVGLPRGARWLTVWSRTWVPAEMELPSTDWRRLGVAMAGVALDGVALDGRGLALDDARLGSGWQAAEAAWRWTDGAGQIDVGGVREVRLRVAMAGIYWETGAAEALTA